MYVLYRRPLDERDYRYEGGGGVDRWGGPDMDRRRDAAHPYMADPQDRLPPPSERLNPGYLDGGGPAAFAAAGGYAGDRYDRYPVDAKRYAGESAPYEAGVVGGGGRGDYYPNERLPPPASRKYPTEDDFQTLRQRYDEEY